MKMLFFVLLVQNLWFLTSCSTSPKVEKGTDQTTEAIPEKMPLKPNQPQIEIRGYVGCDRQVFVDYNALKVDLRDSNNKLGLAVPLNVAGGFEFMSRGNFGKHNVRLIEKKTNKILDRIEFYSTEKKKSFDLKLSYCK